MSFKESTNTASTGTAAKFGAADINLITSTLNGDLDVAAVDINSSWTFRSGKLLQRNPANTFSYIVTNGAIVANRIVNEPVLTGTDTRVYEAHTQTLSNKTLDATCDVDAALPGGVATLTGVETLTNKTLTLPIISSISNTGVITLPISTDTLVGKNTVDTLTNKNTSALVVDDYVDYTKISAPTDPGAEVGRVYLKEVDANNNALAIKQQVGGNIIEVLLS